MLTDVNNIPPEVELMQLIIELYALCEEYGTDFTKQEARRLMAEKGYSVSKSEAGNA